MNFTSANHDDAPASWAGPRRQCPHGAVGRHLRASRYARLPRRGKEPLTPHGFKDAACDLAQIRRWWERWPDANIGAAMGHDLWCLDVDPRGGGDDTLHDLEQRYGAIPPTLTSHTGGGGLHKFFRPPPGGVVNKADIGAGLDVQGLGGYVILPPSLHPNGRNYVWDFVEGIEDIMLQRAPTWLEQLVTVSRAPNSQAKAVVSANGTIPEGRRENTMMRIAAWHARQRQHAWRDSRRPGGY